MMESSIVDFHQYLYIPEIRKFVFCLPHVLILGTHHCGNIRQEAFKCCSYFQYVLWHRYYAESIFSSFALQIKYKYYCGNSSVSI